MKLSYIVLSFLPLNKMVFDKTPLMGMSINIVMIEIIVAKMKFSPGNVYTKIFKHLEHNFDTLGIVNIP